MRLGNAVLLLYSIPASEKSLFSMSENCGIEIECAYGDNSPHEKNISTTLPPDNSNRGI